MNWDAIGAIGEIVGAAGVIASLVYLSIQIRRSDQSTRAQSLQTVLDGHRDRTLLNIYTNSEFSIMLSKGMTNFELLSSDEKPRFQTFVTELVLQMQQVMQLHEGGLLPKVDFDAWLYYTATVIRSPGAQACWPYIETTITPTIKDLLNNYLKDNPDTPSYNEINPLWTYSGANDT